MRLIGAVSCRIYAHDLLLSQMSTAWSLMCASAQGREWWGLSCSLLLCMSCAQLCLMALMTRSLHSCTQSAMSSCPRSMRVSGPETGACACWVQAGGC